MILAKQVSAARRTCTRLVTSVGTEAYNVQVSYQHSYQCVWGTCYRYIIEKIFTLPIHYVYRSPKHSVLYIFPGLPTGQRFDIAHVSHINKNLVAVKGTTMSMETVYVSLLP